MSTSRIIIRAFILMLVAVEGMPLDQCGRVISAGSERSRLWNLCRRSCAVIRLASHRGGALEPRDPGAKSSCLRRGQVFV